MTKEIKESIEEAINLLFSELGNDPECEEALLNLNDKFRFILHAERPPAIQHPEWNVLFQSDPQIHEPALN